MKKIIYIIFFLVLIILICNINLVEQPYETKNRVEDWGKSSLIKNTGSQRIRFVFVNFSNIDIHRFFIIINDGYVYNGELKSVIDVDNISLSDEYLGYENFYQIYFLGYDKFENNVSYWRKKQTYNINSKFFLVILLSNRNFIII